MDAFCLDVLNSDWHDYRGSGKNVDRLLKPGWPEQLAARWGVPVSEPPDAHTLVALQSLRSLMQRIVQKLLQKQLPAEEDIAALNTYLDGSPSRLHLRRVGKHLQLQQVPLHNDWNRVLGEAAVSFATLLVDHDLTRIKQCENPDCRWVYLDESANQSRRWCEESCANLMRVRRYRSRHQGSNEVKTR